MTAFEPITSGVRSDHSVNCATTNNLRRYVFFISNFIAVDANVVAAVDVARFMKHEG